VERTFDPVQLLAVLNKHGVRYVVVGGFAALAHGSPLPTNDVDVTPERSTANLAALSDALSELGARIRVAGIPDGLVFRHNARSLADVTVLNLTTRLGELDLVMQPAGGRDYYALADHGLLVGLHGVPVTLASLDDVIHSKEAAGREKDRLALPVLRALQRRLDEQVERAVETDS